MKFKLEVNTVELDQVFESEEAVKEYLNTWNRAHAFEVEDSFLNVDQFFEMLKEELCVSCYSMFMCEMGDDYVEIALIVVSE
jgi:predicted HAD superfamily phosphohydrolase